MISHFNVHYKVPKGFPPVPVIFNHLVVKLEYIVLFPYDWETRALAVRQYGSHKVIPNEAHVNEVA